MNHRFFASWQNLAIAGTAAIAIGLPVRGFPQPEPTIAQTAGDVELTPLTRANNQFAIDFYHQLNRESDGNLLFSPYSLSVALAMTYAGARGETAQQMGRVFHFPWQGDRLHAGFSQLQQHLETSEDPDTQIDTANRIWLQHNHHFLATFLQVARSYYNTEPELLNFAEQPEECRSRINEWVSERTHGKINELIPNGVIDNLTRFVLTNAIYLKTVWFSPFDPEATTPEPFAIAPNRTVIVPMMKQSVEADYTFVDGLHVLRLWYTDDRLSMVILFPQEGDDIEDIEAELTPDNLYAWISSLTYQGNISLLLPKFRIETNFDLSEALSDMGMPDAFARRADFSGMSALADLKLTKVIHSTFIEVNEAGTEAAGATAVIASTRGGSLDLQLDRPFIFLIWDEETESILFLGRLVDPR